MGALPRRRIGAHDRLPNQPGIDPSAEHIVADVDGADLLVVVVHDIELHRYFLPFFGFSTCATFSFLAVTALRMIT